MRQLKRFFLFTMLLSHALTKPISPGENIWQVNAFSCEQSEETTSKICEIESKLDTIDLDSGNSIDSVTDILCSKLAELETCIPITQEDIDAGFIISSPGKYCLVENVSHTSVGNAILIDTDNVTLDLCGHTIDGTNTGTTGIRIANANNVIVKNGRIINTAFDGLVINGATRICVSNVKSSENNRYGFSIISLTHAVFDHCIAQDNNQNGFYSWSNIRYCIFRNCIANNNSQNGFYLNEISTSGLLSSNTFIQCQANSNTQAGFLGIPNAAGSSIVNTTLCKCIAIDNATGFDFDAVSAFDTILMSCKAIDNTTGFAGNSSTGAFNNFAKANTTSYSGITTPISMIDQLDTDIGFWTNNDQ